MGARFTRPSLQGGNASRFTVIAFMALHILTVFLEQSLSVFPADDSRGRDMVLVGLQPGDDLFRRVRIDLPAVSVQVGHYPIEPVNCCLCTIDEL